MIVMCHQAHHVVCSLMADLHRPAFLIDPIDGTTMSVHLGLLMDRGMIVVGSGASGCRRHDPGGGRRQGAVIDAGPDFSARLLVMP